MTTKLIHKMNVLVGIILMFIGASGIDSEGISFLMFAALSIFGAVLMWIGAVHDSDCDK